MKNITPELKFNLCFNPVFEKVDLEKLFSFVCKSPDLKNFLKIACEIAEKRGEFLYFAGGVVRDFLLKKETSDFDLVLQGNLDEFLKELCKKVKGKIVFKTRFLTYKFKLDLEKSREFLIDFITARKEVYPEIASLPEVVPANWEEDIKRRDFTINSLIIGLTPPYRGFLIDCFCGKEDLEKGIIKPLKPDSFVEDPTRIFRGIRYKVRFNFKFGEEFFICLQECYKKNALKKLSSSRLANELLLFLNKEPRENLYELLKTTFNLKIFEKIEVPVTEKEILFMCEILEKTGKKLLSKEKNKFFLLVLSGEPGNGEKLSFSPEEVKKLDIFFKKFKNRVKNWKKMKIWEKVEFLEKFPLFFVLFAGVKFEELKEDVINFVLNWRDIKSEITGEEIIRMGITEGKKIGEVLKLLRRKKLEGKFSNKAQEMEFLKRKFGLQEDFSLEEF